MKITKKFIALILGAVMLLGMLAGCGEPATEPEQSKTPHSQSPILSGMLVLSVQAAFEISYDQNGMVMELNSANEEGEAIVSAYTDFAGKSCSAVVKDLIAATAEATLLRNARNVVLKLAIGSQLPTETFLESLANDAATAVADNSGTAFVVAIGLDGLDEEGYINAENAQNLLKNELGVTAFDSYNGDTTPRNDCYTVYVKADGVEASYLINAVTGLITEIVDEEPAEPDYIEEEELDPSFEEEAEETIDEDVEVEIPE